MRKLVMIVAADAADPTPIPLADEARERGAMAETPRNFSWLASWVIVKRVWANSGAHNLSLLAAGVAFYSFLSFVPLLAALVMVYGLVADPSAVADHMQLLIDLVPADAARLIYEQLTQLTQDAENRKGVGLAAALMVSIYGASRASGAMITSLNIIYEERDRRSYFRWLAVSAALAGGGLFSSRFAGSPPPRCSALRGPGPQRLELMHRSPCKC